MRPRRQLPAFSEVLHRADVDAGVAQLRMRGLDVGDDDVRPTDRARLGVGDALADRDRAGRARRGQLDDAEVVARLVVDVDVEAELLGVERPWRGRRR